jgi:hypothetical protein
MHQSLNQPLYVYHRDVIQSESESHWPGPYFSMEATASKNTVPWAIEAGRHLQPVPDNFHKALAHKDMPTWSKSSIVI